MKKMKKFLTLGVILLMGVSSFAQVAINKDGSNPYSKSILHVKANNGRSFIISDSSGNVGINNYTPTSELDVNGLIQGGFGARTTSGVKDWNAPENTKSGNGNTLLRASATNGFTAGGSNYYHAFNYEYYTKNGTGNLLQYALPYGTTNSINRGMFMRGRYQNIWTPWVRIISENTAGNVGIGTTSPHEKLEVQGNIRMVDGNEGDGKVMVSNDNGTASWADLSDIGGDFDWAIDGTSMYSQVSGNVGIGTSTPDAKLDVNGQIKGGFGAMTTSGIVDWNDISNTKSGNGTTLLRANATNGPIVAGSRYYHPFNFEYASKSGSGNITQLAIPYGHSASIDNGMYMRGRYSSDWSPWVKIISENTVGNVGIGTNSPTEKLDINGAMHLTPGSTPTTANEGDIYMDATTHKLRCYDGSTWHDLW